MPNEQLQARLLRGIVENFFKTGRGVRRFQLVTDFRDRSLVGVLEELIRKGVIRREMSGNLEEYAPSLPAIILAGTQDEIRKAKKNFILIGELLAALFFEQSGQTAISVAALLDRAQKITPTFTRDELLLGCYLLQDVGLSGGYVAAANGEISTVHTSERLALVDDFDREWNDQVRLRLPQPDSQMDEALSQGQTGEGGAALDLELGKLSSWHKLGTALGAGGQAEVWLVRSPDRQREIRKSVDVILSFQNRRAIVQVPEAYEGVLAFAQATSSLSREELPSDLGALKQFKIPEGPERELAVHRLRREIQVLSKGVPGLIKLLDFNEAESWIVTEYFPCGSLAKQISLFKGRAQEALRAFRTVVQTVALLHEGELVHRDIKPPNVYVRSDEELVLGDLGIVYVPEDGTRVTMTNEKVGARDYMPPWVPIDERQDLVKPDFDVYMLGKLLWCMVAGRLRLQREYHNKPEWNLEILFPKQPAMRKVNRILDACLTENPDECPKNASELLKIVDGVLESIESKAQPLDVPRPCRVCGKGFYKSQGYNPSTALVVTRYEGNHHAGSVRLVPFVCDYCTHFEFFAPGFPEEAAKRDLR